MQCVILAGGKGTRLNPLTKKIPKHMIKINGSPFLEILLKSLKEKGFDNFVLCVGYRSEIIENYFKDGKKFRINLQYSRENKPLGTAGALLNTIEILDNEFIVINGDTFVDIDFVKFIKFSKKKNKQCTICCNLDPPNSLYFNNLYIDDDLCVRKYSKDKKLSQMNGIDVGIYYFKKRSLEPFIETKFCTLEYDIIPSLIHKNEVDAFPVNEKFYPLNTPKDLKIFKKYYGNWKQKQ